MNWFRRMFTRKQRNPIVQHMTFHLYNLESKLRGTCSFELIDYLHSDNNENPVYAVAMACPDSVDRHQPKRVVGHAEALDKLDATILFYCDHKNAVVEKLSADGVAWRDMRSCLITLPQHIPVDRARTVLYSLLHENNDMGSSMPHLLRTLKTRREL